MPRDASGNYTRVPGTPYVPDTVIDANVVNAEADDIGAQLSDSLSRSGKGGMLADLDMGGKKVINAAAGTASTDLATVGQAQGATLFLFANYF